MIGPQASLAFTSATGHDGHDMVVTSATGHDIHPYFVCLLCLIVWYLYEPTVMKEPTVRSGAADMEPTVMKEPLGYT